MATSDDRALLLAINADVNSLERQMRRITQAVDSGANRAERRLQTMSTRVRTAFSSSFDSGRQSLLARTGPLAEGLGAVGAAGLVAAGGIVAVAAAVRGAMQVAEWADQLQSTAQALHLTSEELQELRGVAIQAGIPIETMDANLQALFQTLGQAQAGGRAGRQSRAIFNALGITNEELARIHNVRDLLPQLADGLQRIARVAPAEAASLGARLGMSPELIRQLEQGRDRIEGLIVSARRLGLVMDESLVRQSAEAAEKMRVASQVIDTQLRVALASVAPLLTGVATGFAQGAVALGNFVREVQDALGPLASLVGLLARLRVPGAGTIGSQVRDAAQAAQDSGFPFGRFGGQPLQRLLREGDRQRRERALLEYVGGIQGEVAGYMAPSAAPTLFPDTGRGGRAPRAPDDGWVLVPGGGPEGRGVLVWMHNGRLDFGLTNPGINSAVEEDRRAVDPETLGLRDIDQSVSLREPLNIDRDLQQIHDQFADTIAGALEAGIHGGWPGLVDYMRQTMERRFIDYLADQLANMLAEAQFKGEAGGGGFFQQALQFGAQLFGGGKPPGYNALGTDNWRGGATWVGEHGRELAVFGAGTRIISNENIRKAASAKAGGAMVFTYAPSIDATGADPAALARVEAQIIAQGRAMERTFRAIDRGFPARLQAMQQHGH